MTYLPSSSNGAVDMGIARPVFTTVPSAHACEDTSALSVRRPSSGVDYPHAQPAILPLSHVPLHRRPNMMTPSTTLRQIETVLTLTDLGVGIKDYTRVTTGEFAERVGISQQTASRWLTEAADTGIIRRLDGVTGSNIRICTPGMMIVAKHGTRVSLSLRRMEGMFD